MKQEVPLRQSGWMMAVSENHLYMTDYNYREKASYLIVYNRNVVRNESGEITEEQYEYDATYTIPNSYFEGVSVNFEPTKNNGS